MAVLDKPYEIYEWGDDETREFTIERWEMGDLEIHPRDGRPPKMISVLRLHVPTAEKTEYPSYWDLTSSRLVAQLKQILEAHRGARRRVKITAIGKPPRTHFSVTWLPEGLA